jgi:hypothetical protein
MPRLLRGLFPRVSGNTSATRPAVTRRLPARPRGECRR